MNNDITSRIPPNDKDAEQAVLGAVFLSQDALIEAMEYVEADDFYQHANQLVFQAMMNLNDEEEPVDVVTVQNELDRQNQIEDIGGVSYLAELANAVPTAANTSYYAKIVKNKSVLRRLINAATSIVSRSFEEDEDVDSIIDQSEKDIMDVSENRNHKGFRRISDVVKSSFEEIDKLYDQDSDVTGLSTGYKDLDAMTTGLHKDELIILAARPGVGKTAFALNLAQNAATKSNATVAIFSLEMGAEQLVNRMLCSEGSIDANSLRTGKLDENQWNSLVVAMGSLSRTNVYIDDTPGVKMAEIRSKCRRLLKESGKLDLVIVDYLQLIEGTGQENRQQEVSVISRGMKKLAKELHVPIIALSQLSRGVEARQDKRPMLSDIRESGSIEQDADIVAFLYRDDYYRDEDGDDNDNQEDPEDQDVGEVEVIVSKNRSGPRGTAKLLFVKSYNKFSSIANIPEN
ncbi:replicative DNA helicase [Companilactobacillus paralimentarius DSM 13238 = JCM 10415]|uniref:Replicative DNA helicase n=3 Tax=Companilactobacillus TaxID=2767879 RepID=A0ABR5NX22_9LACO|nr:MULTISPECIES: replicative DNA helicase [Companilactobacillus]KAE9559976.1 replicative DNA helicase [Companilactobacillus kimchii]KAE9565243.1 replicative DNA helicase [Companilactobacillus paralimentarius]KRK53492.1 replicative DNA helicase [Companilactobacillus kimchii DSM 13961 = JCM 10707]KRL31596.1 replicative DNA helicase [Companilactobacillus paralimentarius DSM 13238 = JCM 10415]OWF33520.1 DNA helicase [Companilactobacillus kimchii]